MQASRWMKVSFDPGLDGELLRSDASSHLRVPGLVRGRRQLARRPRPAVPVPPLSEESRVCVPEWAVQSWSPEGSREVCLVAEDQGRWSGGEVLSPGTGRMCQAWSRQRKDYLC